MKDIELKKRFYKKRNRSSTKDVAITQLEVLEVSSPPTGRDWIERSIMPYRMARSTAKKSSRSNYPRSAVQKAGKRLYRRCMTWREWHSNQKASGSLNSTTAELKPMAIATFDDHVLNKFRRLVCVRNLGMDEKQEQERPFVRSLLVKASLRVKSILWKQSVLFMIDMIWIYGSERAMIEKDHTTDL